MIQSAEISIGTDHGQLFIGVPGDHPPGSSPLLPTFKITVKNYGNSPAINFAWKPSIRYMSMTAVEGSPQLVSVSERQSDRNFPYIRDRGEWSDSLASGEPVEITLTYGFSLNAIEEKGYRAVPPTGSVFVGVVLALSYEDVFQKQHTENYGFMVSLANSKAGYVKMSPVDVWIFETMAEMQRRREAKEK